MDEDKRTKMMSRVQALLARAASSEFEAEADASRKKAAELMYTWQIEEAELVQKGDQRAPVPAHRVINIDWYDNIKEEDVRSALWTIFNSTIRYTGTLGAPYTNFVAGSHVLEIVGLPADLDYMELLFTSLFMECMTRMSPQVSPQKTMLQNLISMKEVGYKWETIGNELVRIGQLDRYTRNVGVKFTKMYADHCKSTGRTQIKINPDVYKRSFIQGFQIGVMRKLKEMADAKDQAFDTGGLGLVLRDNRVDVQAFWQERFGHIKKDYAPVRYGARMLKFDDAAVARGIQSGLEAAVQGRPGESVGQRIAGELS